MHFPHYPSVDSCLKAEKYRTDMRTIISSAHSSLVSPQRRNGHDNTAYPPRLNVRHRTLKRKETKNRRSSGKTLPNITDTDNELYCSWLVDPRPSTNIAHEFWHAGHNYPMLGTPVLVKPSKPSSDSS